MNAHPNLVLACLVIGSTPIAAADDPWSTYCANPTPENAIKVQSANLPNLDAREFERRLQILEDQVLCSDVEAVRLVYRLKQESDGAYSEFLSQTLCRLVRINPRLFLEELARHRQQVKDRLPWVLCSTGAGYVDRVAAQRYVLRKRLAAIRTVDDPDLRKLRDECSAALQRKIADLGEHLEKSDPAQQGRLERNEKPHPGVRPNQDSKIPAAGASEPRQITLPRLKPHFLHDQIGPGHGNLPPGDWDLRVIERQPVDRSKPASGLMKQLEPGVR